MGIITFLLGNKNLMIGLILIALVAGTGVYIKVLKSELATAEAEKVTLKTELQVSQNSVKNLQSSIDNQNTAIAKLKADADVRVAAHQGEINTAKQTALTYKQQAQDLMKVIPKIGVEKCDAVNQLINQEIKK